MKTQTIAILGAGQCQVPIIKQAQQMGFEVVAISVDGNYPGFRIADKYYKVDVRSKEQILEIVKQEGICGILTDQTDIPVTTVAYVAEQMGLPGIGYDCALSFTNKYLMRQISEKIGVPVPKSFQTSSLNEAYEQAQQLGFPLIIKPVDNQGSRGVSKVLNLEQLEAKFQLAASYSASGFAILEEFFSGKEVVVQGFVSNFNFTNLAIGDRDYFNLPDLFIPKRTIFPSLLKQNLQEKIIALNTRLIKNLNPKFGITHSEYLVNEDTGEVRLVETAIRGGGVFISSDLIPLACGININKHLIELASGRETNINIDTNGFLNRAAGYVCFFLPEGIISKVEGIEKISYLPGVHKAYLQDIKVGKRTLPITDKTMRLGPILITSKDRSLCQEIIHHIQETLVVEVETANGIKGIEW
jgi:carbamoyl-phosphate synthase large subunit